MEQLDSSLELFDVSDVSTASCEIFDESSSTSCANIWHSTPIKKSAYAHKDPAPECPSECSETEIEVFDQSTASGKYCNLNACQIHFLFLSCVILVLTVVFYADKFNLIAFRMISPDLTRMILLQLLNVFYSHTFFFVSVEREIEDTSFSNLSIDILDQTVEGGANGFNDNYFL